LSERAGPVRNRQALAKETDAGEKLLERWANAIGPIGIAGGTPFTLNLAANHTSAYNRGYPSDLRPIALLEVAR